MSSADETAKEAGRGGLAIAGAKVTFMILGMAQKVLLTFLLGVAGFGHLQRIFTPLNLVNNVTVGSAIQGVSHVVSSANEAERPAAFRRALAVHAVLAGIAALGFFFAAPFVASFLEAEHITGELRFVALIVALYGIYAPLVGSLNGTRRFTTQAGLDVTYALLRTGGLAVGALVAGIGGALVGFTAAALAIVPIAALRSGLGKRGEGGQTTGSYLAYFAPLLGGQIALNVLMVADFTLLSRFAGLSAKAAGLDPKAADELVGAYGSAQLFSFLPYQLILSVSFVLFPMLARARAEQDRPAVASYTRAGVRLALVITGLICAVVSGLAPHLLRLAFPIQASELAGGALRILSLGMGAFAVLAVCSTALTSVGRSGVGALLNVGAAILIATGCWLTVPSATFGPEMLERTASATAAALVLTAAISAVLLYRNNGAFAPPASLARVALALGVAIAVATRLPYLGKIAVVAESALVVVVYAGVLALTRELGAADIARIKQVFGRRS